MQHLPQQRSPQRRSHSNPSQILPGLFLGTVYHAIHATTDFELVVNCTKGEACWASKDYVRVPVDDSASDAFRLYKILRDMDVLHKIHTYIANQASKKVLVHCQMGQQRSPTVVACYLVMYHGMAVDEAMEFIKQRRSVAFAGGCNMINTIQFLYHHLQLNPRMLQHPGPSQILPGLFVGTRQDAAAHAAEFEFVVSCVGDDDVMPEGVKSRAEVPIPECPYYGDPYFRLLRDGTVLDDIRKYLVAGPEMSEGRVNADAHDNLHHQQTDEVRANADAHDNLHHQQADEIRANADAHDNLHHEETGENPGTVGACDIPHNQDAVPAINRVVPYSAVRGEDKRVLVYCGSGEQRAPAVVACYLVKFHDLTPNKAVAFIKERRPIAFCYEARLDDMISDMYDHCTGEDYSEEDMEV